MCLTGEASEYCDFAKWDDFALNNIELKSLTPDVYAGKALMEGPHRTFGISIVLILPCFLPPIQQISQILQNGHASSAIADIHDGACLTKNEAVVRQLVWAWSGSLAPTLFEIVPNIAERLRP